jgi:protein-S-isoprenylcysteine O-methyltransferase Ste14
MELHARIEQQGHWLFRWRSYFPLIILPLVAVAFFEYNTVERLFGDGAENTFKAFCILMSFSGLMIRALTIGYVPRGTSGRNTRGGQKADYLNSTGMYSIVRHPLYLGNFLIFMGAVFFIQSLWFSVIASLLFALYYERIMFAEEAYLRQKYGAAFTVWAATVPAFIPKLARWTSPELRFSMRNILKREYTGLFYITAIFPLIDLVGDYVSAETFMLNPGWGLFFLTGLVLYTTLRTLKKRTRLLHAEGR